MSPDKKKEGVSGITKFIIDFLMGGVSAAVVKTAVAPIERVKLLLLNQWRDPMEGIIECLRCTVAEDGVLALWRGNKVNVMRYSPTQALNFALKDQFKRVFAVPKSAPFWKTLAANFISGGLAGASSLFFVYSLDYPRPRLFSATGGGVVGLYRGFMISAVGIFVYRGLYFGLYDSFKPLTTNYTGDNLFFSFFIGWGITVIASLTSYPIDTVRRRMLMTSGAGVKYSGSIDCFIKIIKAEGSQALFKGAGNFIPLRAVAGAGVLAAYDRLQVIVVGKGYSG